jgi:hypothetical protein
MRTRKRKLLSRFFLEPGYYNFAVHEAVKYYGHVFYQHHVIKGTKRIKYHD